MVKRYKSLIFFNSPRFDRVVFTNIKNQCVSILNVSARNLTFKLFKLKHVYHFHVLGFDVSMKVWLEMERKSYFVYRSILKTKYVNSFGKRKIKSINNKLRKCPNYV